ncbi:MAG: ferritin [Candidatus Eisenbacteria bacterium]|jgi:ferritin|nr:ferritin [Candidatus Eisenbacteria bacterium]
MISKKMEEALNAQINEEMFSSYLYLAMAAYYTSIDLPGFSAWMRVQAKEEETHALKFFDFIEERGGRVVLEAIRIPPRDWASATHAFEAALAHERSVTARIHKLVDVARAETDYATEFFLHWFVNEQVEEEATAEAIVKRLQMMGESKNGLLMLDHHLAKRGAD